LILENIWQVGLIFIITILFFYIATGKYLRPKNIFDTYTFFYLFIGSFFALHVLVFKLADVSSEFILLFTLSTILFSISFLITSFFLNKKMGVFLNIICNNQNKYSGYYKLYKFNNFLVIFIISMIIATIISIENIYKFNALTDLHGENAEYVLNNYSARLIVYLGSFLPFASLYFFSYLLIINEKKKFKSILSYVYISLAIMISLISNSRASVVNLFLPLGLISFHLYYYNYNLFKKVSKIQILLAIFAISYAVYLGYLSNNDLMAGASAIFVRLFMTSDVVLWYHLGNLNVDMFKDYNLTYFLHPILSPLGLSHIDAGLGPVIAELGGNKAVGKGPLPSYFYEAYLTSNSWPFVLVYSVFVGFLLPYFRYYSIKLFLKSDIAYKYFFIAAILYFINGRFLIDFLSFETKVIVSLATILLFIYSIKIVLNKKNVSND